MALDGEMSSPTSPSFPILSLPVEILIRILSMSLVKPGPYKPLDRDLERSRKLRLVNRRFNSLVLDTILGTPGGLYELYKEGYRGCYTRRLREWSLTLLLRIKEQKAGHRSTAISLIRRVRETVTQLLLSGHASVLGRALDGDIEVENKIVIETYVDGFIEAMVAYLGPRATLEHLVVEDMTDDIVFRGTRLGNYDYLALAAVWLGKEEVLSFLLDSGRAKGSAEFFVAALLVNASGGHTQMFHFLQRRGYTPLNVAGGEQGRLLWIAASKGHLDMIRLYLKAGADVDSISNVCDTALLAAADEANDSVGKLLLESGADPNFQSDYKRSPLHILSRRPPRGFKADKALNFIRILLKHGANIEDYNDFQPTPIYVAAKAGNFEAVSLLLDGGANANPYHRNHLYRAIVPGDLAVLELLLDHGLEIHREEYMVEMMSEAVLYGHENIVELLAKRNGNRDNISKLTVKLLDWAVLDGRPGMVKKLIELGADIGEHESELVEVAAERRGWRDVECLRLLFLEGLPISNRFLEAAVLHGQNEIVKKWLKKDPGDFFRSRGIKELNRLLNEAFYHGDITAAAILIDAGAYLEDVTFGTLDTSDNIHRCLNLLRIMEERHPMDRKFIIWDTSSLDRTPAIVFYALRAGRDMGKINQAWACAKAMGSGAVELMEFFSENFSRVKDRYPGERSIKEEIQTGNLALAKLLIPWYAQFGNPISFRTAMKEAKASGSQGMVKYILDWFQSGYNKGDDSQYYEWKTSLENEFYDAVWDNHFPTVRQIERYWRSWTSNRQNKRDHVCLETPVRLLEAAIVSKSEIQLRFVLNSDMIEPGSFFKPDTTAATAIKLSEELGREIFANAIITGNVFIAKMLVAGGLNLSQRVPRVGDIYERLDWSPIRDELPEEWAPLTLAAYTGQGEMVKYLLAVGANRKLAHEEMSRPRPQFANRSLVKLVMESPA